MVRGLSAGTTVSATMLLAERAGIRVFATGGVGGVHRGAEHTFDISADLVELGRTPTAVVCAGVKSILDIPKTLEFLETQRVPVIAFGTDEFPAFYTPHSGQKAGLRLDTPEDLARAIALHHRLGAGTGLLIANPIPAGDALDAAAMKSTIRSAVAEADRLGIGGKELTPFLLAKINELTKGASLGANIALVQEQRGPRGPHRRGARRPIATDWSLPMAYETILLEKDADDAFAILTLNRPDKLNAIDKTVIREIVHAVKACSVDPAINALVIRGAGRSFSAGYDLQGGDFDVDVEFWRDDMTENAEAWLEIYRAPIPVLASVHGYALAGALELMMCCDLAIVADTAQVSASPRCGTIPARPRS